MKRNLKNIISGLLNSFISRNNDVNGYWGIGKLYALMIDNNCLEVRINLLEKRIKPESLDFNFLINDYSNKLISKIEDVGLFEEDISSVNIFLKSNVKNLLNKDYETVPLLCSIKMIYKENIILKYEQRVMCRKHNLNLESKSCRNYSK
ncbi:hypothetical protein [uncultured Tenacibaculum sp.]|uniref:hypothetical protein n=1 Tax=uncultured Tenacibaculum sp. TaxID=174713 RepID=UPI002618034F|nr:hypothetical protein [uncultured Tenacibaculum sp.]